MCIRIESSPESRTRVRVSGEAGLSETSVGMTMAREEGRYKDPDSYLHVGD